MACDPPLRTKLLLTSALTEIRLAEVDLITTRIRYSTACEI